MILLADNTDPSVHLYKPTTKFRRRPKVIQAYKNQQQECETSRGHVIVANKGGLRCESCGAEWKDEGF